MTAFKKLLAFISDLRVAIILFIVIALASSLGTIIPQGEPKSRYLELFNEKPWL